MMSEGVGKHMYDYVEIGPVVHECRTARPDRLLHDMGSLVEDYGDKEGFVLLWDFFAVLKDFGLICRPEEVMVSGHKVISHDPGRRTSVLSVSGLGLDNAFLKWMDKVSLHGSFLNDSRKCLNDVFLYFCKKELLNKTVMAWGFFSEPPGRCTQDYYPYMEIPTYEWRPSLEDDGHEA